MTEDDEKFAMRSAFGRLFDIIDKKIADAVAPLQAEIAELRAERNASTPKDAR